MFARWTNVFENDKNTEESMTSNELQKTQWANSTQCKPHDTQMQNDR